MLNVTTAAAQKLHAIIQDASPSDGECFRIQATPEGLDFTLDLERPGDTAITHGGAKVLVLESKIADALRGRTLELTDTEEGPAFALS